MTGRTENILIDDVTEMGYAAMRAPASGARSSHYAGDVWIADRIVTEAPDWIERQTIVTTKLWIVEEKYKSDTNKRHIFEYADKIDKMIELSESIGATPLMAVRWSNRCEWSPGPTHLIADAREIERTDSGNLSISPDDTESDTFGPTCDFFSED